MGDWQDGQFKFASPDAERQWAVEAYRSGVSAKDWHRGTPIDDQTRDLVQNDLGGATPPYFRGPDGQYRFSNAYTIEPQDVRDHRLRALRGVKIDDLTGPEMPGEAELAAQFVAAAQASQQTPPIKVANDNPPPPAVAVKLPADRAAAKTAPGIGRFAHMAAAQKEAGYLSPEEALQHIDDGIRLLANGVTLGYADNLAAAGNALLTPGSFAENYDRNIGEEKELTKAAEVHSGVVGAIVGSLPQLIPGAGDALGVAGDIKMYLEDPSTRTLGNAGKTLLGALPFVPSLASSINRVDEAIETAAKVGAKTTDKVDDLSDAAKLEKESSSGTTAPKPETIRIDIDDPASVDSYLKRSIEGNEGPDGHMISKHVGKTKEELLKRYEREPRITGSSSFPDLATAQRLVQDCLQHNKSTIMNWLSNPNALSTLYIAHDAKSIVGMTVKKDGTVLQPTSIQVGLAKDGDGGFYFYTAFPK